MSASSSLLTERLRDRAFQRVIPFLWFGIIPALCALVWVRYFVPAAAAPGEGGFFGYLARQRAEQPIWLVLGLFLIVAMIVRYWAPRLPRVRDVFAKDNRPTNARSLVWFALVIAVAGGLGLGVRAFALRSHRVVGTSMLPGLEPGDLLAVNQLAFRGGNSARPRRGDIVVFRRGTATRGPEDLVKRAIGLPGDHVEMKRGRPIVNGFTVPSCAVGRYIRKLDGKLVYGKMNVEFLDDAAYLTLDETGRGTPDVPGFTVPSGQVFVLGDQRDDTLDSRTLDAGNAAGVPLDRLEGRVDRLLLGNREPEAPWWRRVMQRVDPAFRLDGMDTRGLKMRITRCLETRPRVTRVPSAAPGSRDGNQDPNR